VLAAVQAAVLHAEGRLLFLRAEGFRHPACAHGDLIAAARRLERAAD